MRKLIFTLILILACYIGYMYFFGKEEDKVQAHTIVTETKDLGKSVGDFLTGQKDKYDDGAFDALLKKIGDSIDALKSKSGKKSDEVTKDLRDLETQLKKIDPQKLSEENRTKLKKLLDELEKELN